MNFVWSTGEKYEKSHKNDKAKYSMSKNTDNEKSHFMNNEKSKFDLEEIKTQQVVGLKYDSNRREEANDKINERHLICQTHQNPFLANNNYVNDLEIQSKFLIPRTEANTPKYD